MIRRISEGRDGGVLGPVSRKYIHTSSRKTEDSLPELESEEGIVFVIDQLDA